MIRVSAVIIDCDWQGLGLPSGARGNPQFIEFNFDGLWYEALEQLTFEYSARYRGGRRIDADLLLIKAISMMNLATPD